MAPRRDAGEPGAPSGGGRPQPGTLYLVGTPIGNLSDITLRAVETLRLASTILAEDTRRTRALLSHLGIAGKTLSSVNANTPKAALARWLDVLTQGTHLALVTDAGMPSVSDPGAALVQGAAARRLRVVCIPGPSAVTTAAAVSGLVSGAFLFLGFPPRRGKKRTELLKRIASSGEPVILFESPLRTPALLEELAASIPTRRAAVCRELTKLHEQVLRGSLQELSQGVQSLRGEVTLVIEAGSGAVEPKLTGTALDQEIEALLASGLSTKSVVSSLGERVVLARQALYARVQALRDGQSRD